ncbi:MAG: M48 family metalloprotease, partial [Spirillospora sp.]
MLLVLALVLIVLAPLFSRLVYMAMRRKREYLADATGVQLTRNPHGLASALRKIKGDLPDDPKGSRTAAS